MSADDSQEDFLSFLLSLRNADIIMGAIPAIWES